MEQTNTPEPQLNGFTMEQIDKMCNHPLEEGCPVQLRHMTEEEIGQIPFIGQALHLMNSLSNKEIALTPQGMLPPKIVEKLYPLGGYDWDINSFRIKEEDIVPGIRPLRMVLKDTGLTKVSLGKLFLTEKGKRLQESGHKELVQTIILYMLTSFNTGWHDGMEQFDLANVGRLYSLWLLHRYGGEWVPFDFYANEYFKAFPTLRKDTGTKYFSCEDIYRNRILFYLFSLIGLCESREIRDPKTQIVTIEVRKNSVLDMLFSFEDPAKI